MSAENKRALEAIVMVADTPVPTEMLAQLTSLAPQRVEELLNELGAEYARDERGFQLVRVAGGWRYQSHPDQAPY
ncbi:MAG: SMC-Scp complex subunit ScpB, partial [Actinomycetes bacterium]